VNKVHLIMAVWGQAYIDMFLNLSLASQLSPGNLPAIGHIDGLVYKIYTTKKNEAYIRRHPAFQRLSNLVETSIIGVDSLEGEDKFSPLMVFHNRAIDEADRENAALVFLSPDFVLADGTLSSLLRLKAEGYRAVLVLTLRLVSNTAMPDLLKRFHISNEYALAASPRELVKASLRHLHPIERTYYWGPEFSSFPIHAYWPVDDEGVIARCFYLHPIMINPLIKFKRPQITIDADYVDLVCPDRSDIYVVRDSDEIACFELSGKSAIDMNAETRSNFKATTWNYAKWAVVNANPLYSSTLHHWYFQLPIRIHTGDFSPIWEKREKASAKTARWIRRYSLCLRKHANIGEAVYYFFSTKMHNHARSRLWKNRMQIDLTHTGEFSGTGWGEVEWNKHGQRWRWLGQDGKGSLILLLKSKKNYVLKTYIHTALGDSLYALKVEVNGRPTLEQHIIRQGNLFWHLCIIPKTTIAFDGGKAEIVYRVDGDANGPHVALRHLVCRPLNRCPVLLYRIYRRRLGRFIRRHFITKPA